MILNLNYINYKISFTKNRYYNILKNKLYLNMKKMTRIIMYSIMIKTLSIVTYIKI